MGKSTTEEFIKKAKTVHGDRYDYNIVEYIKSSLKVIITCPIHHGFEQRPSHHLKGSGCPKCCEQHKKLTKEEFIKRAKETHKNIYDYSLVNYVKSSTKVIITCPIHHNFEQRPTDHMRGHKCPKCCTNQQLNTEEFIKKSREVHGDRYNYDNAEYKGAFVKLNIHCSLHGMFEQSASKHLFGQGCKTCGGGEKLTTERFIEKAKLVHGDKYNYDKVNYIEAHKKVIIICSLHGEFKQNPSSHTEGTAGCPKCCESKGEKFIRNFLDSKEIPFISQKKFPNCKSKLKLPFDFYLPQYNLLIEFQGRQHYIPIKCFGGQAELELIQKRDQIKRNFAKSNGINLLEIPYNFKREQIIEILESQLMESIM